MTLRCPYPTSYLTLHEFLDLAADWALCWQPRWIQLQVNFLCLFPGGQQDHPLSPTGEHTFIKSRDNRRGLVSFFVWPESLPCHHRSPVASTLLFVALLGELIWKVICFFCHPLLFISTHVWTSSWVKAFKGRSLKSQSTLTICFPLQEAGSYSL